MNLIGLTLAVALLSQTPPLLQEASVTPPVGTAELRGRVVLAASGAAVAGASVILSSGSASLRRATTDENGRFVYTLLPAGRYTLSVSHNGTMVTAFGGSAPRAVSIDLKDGDHVDRGDLVLPAGAVISGQILDEHGDPLAGATVSAWRSLYRAPGDHWLSFAGQARSDATGDYRISGLKPGTYFVDARASDSHQRSFRPRQAPRPQPASR